MTECVVLDKTTVETGYHRFHENLHRLKESIEKDYWPGYSHGELIVLDAPEWAA
ncbi:hypothetical protein [Endozoicomonas sp. ALB091]|uniref:hypothetical protein n=1 Tax=Endozoicomonas sp. ALB091 TaxID=3403073 RepID=UPI003BB5FD6A